MTTPRITMTRLLILLALAGLAKGLVGCETAPTGPVLDSQVVVEATRDRLDTMTTTVEGATSWVDNSTFTADVFRAVGLQEAGESADAPVMPLDPASLANRLSTFLENRVLVPANVVDADEASVTYGIRAADLLCPNTSGSVQTGTGALVAYTQCRVLYADLELLVRAELRDDGMDLTLMVGRDRLEPLTVELRDDVTLARLNLPIALEAASVFMDRLPPSKRAELPEIQALEGEMTLAIETPEPALATVTLEVTEAIRMDLMNQGKPLTLSVAPGVLSVSADGEARELAMAVALGETELLASEGWAFDAGMEVTCGVSDLACAPERRSFQVNGAIVGQLAGLTGEARVQEDTEVFELTGLGLGTSTSRITLDQEEVFSLDLNPADGRLVDLFMIRDTTGLNVEVSPLLDVSAGFYAENAGETFGAAAQSWMANEVIQVILDDSDVPELRFGLPGIRVQSGALSLTSQARPDLNRTLEVGQCLSRGLSGGEHRIAPSSHYAPGHPFELYSVGACDAI